VLCAILPLFALLAPMELACFPAAVALFHLAFGIALSVLLMELLFLGFRKVPFTCSHFPGKINLVALGVIYILGFTMYSSTMAGFESWLAGTPSAAALFFAAAASACLLLNRWQARESDAEATLDYEDRGDPVVRTLDLTPQ
jgi:heme A synthase